eukprot:CAMPEP_0178423818 /NCGR_PEP_ID=MMETSP0689_2-20121128/27883_1 /TAXON_ID=160604 /ORGANISM="Amphidinium massartii, Strain CS-259" /LENGTH=218 /DNA_ID=CAMNT_0020045421 /DNA_START=93 /DNA_END=745 /DNA_ORIENTATION=+
MASAATMSTEQPVKKEWNSCFRSQMRKTQLCRFNAKGKCRYGPSCMFAHSQEELKNVPDLLKTSLCQDFAEGKCPFSSELCPYAHGREELRRTEAFSRKKSKASKQASSDNTDKVLVDDGTSSDVSAPTCSTSLGESNQGDSFSSFQLDSEDFTDGASSTYASDGGCTPCTSMPLCPVPYSEELAMQGVQSYSPTNMGQAGGYYMLVPVVMMPSYQSG